MSIFSNLTTEGMEKAEDVVGGGNFDPVPTGIHDAIVKLAYAITSAGGAKGVSLILDIGGKEVRETVYVTKKTGENFYIDKNDNKRRPMPGFTTIDELCLLTTETHLAEVEMENKMVKIYNKEAGGEVPTEVPVITPMLGQSVKVAMFRKIENKTEKNTNSGIYEPTNESRTINDIVKFMHPETSRTVNEYMQEIEEPVWATEWSNRFGDKDLNKFKVIEGGGAGSSGTGTPGSAGTSGEATPKKKLFG